MTIVIKKKSGLKQIAEAKRKLIRKKNRKSGVGSYFGALKRGLDGLTYQKEARNEWH